MAVLQHPVGRFRLDLAYPAARPGIEYDGRDHLTPTAPDATTSTGRRT